MDDAPELGAAAIALGLSGVRDEGDGSAEVLGVAIIRSLIEVLELV